MNCAIYCRVSTEVQEREGTSLDTQLDACRKFCQSQSLTVYREFRETYSGLSLDRPLLSELRDLARNRQFNVLVIYCIDRLSRDPVHFIILQDELERVHIEIQAVTETVDSSDMGKLISHIRGFAAKLEALKIQERTRRGIKSRIESGRLPAGKGVYLYGYNYVPGKGQGQGIRVINEQEAEVVRKIYDMAVNERLSTYAIADRLNSENAPAPGKGKWARYGIVRILKQSAYAGHTYIGKFRGKAMVKQPRENWKEIPGATPAVISEDIYRAAQAILKQNRDLASRNKHYDYLLSGHLFCACGKPMWAIIKRENGGRGAIYHYYHCSGNCSGKYLPARQTEGAVWKEIEKTIMDPKRLSRALSERKKPNDNRGLNLNIERTHRQLSGLDKEQSELLKWALKGFPENQIVIENKRINAEREKLLREVTSLEKQEAEVKEEEAAAVDLVSFCESLPLYKRGTEFTFAEKRDILRRFNIKVLADDGNLEIRGFIPAILPIVKQSPALSLHSYPFQMTATYKK